jgi:hypothetical protein
MKHGSVRELSGLQERFGIQSAIGHWPLGFDHCPGFFREGVRE